MKEIQKAYEGGDKTDERSEAHNLLLEHFYPSSEQSGADIPFEQEPELYQAAYNGNWDQFIALLDQGVDPYTTSKNGVRDCSYFVMKSILEQENPENNEGLAMLKSLLEAMKKWDTQQNIIQKNTLIGNLVDLINYEYFPCILKLVLEYRSDKINEQFYNGNTLLHHAVLCGNKVVCKILLDCPEVKPNIKNNDGYTAFYIGINQSLSGKGDMYWAELFLEAAKVTE